MPREAPRPNPSSPLLASSIRACGLSLNLLCQQYAEHSLRRLAEGGTRIQLQFLDPDGKSIREREAEENYDQGTLSDLTRINIRSVQDRVRRLLPEEARSRLEIGTYDETIRFNIIVVDEQLAVVQPYLPAVGGVFVLRGHRSGSESASQPRSSASNLSGVGGGADCRLCVAGKSCGGPAASVRWIAKR